MPDTAARYDNCRLRRRIMLALLAAIALVMVARLVWLQVKSSDELIHRGYARSLRNQKEDALRGMIYDRQGEPVAIATPVSTLILDPSRMWSGLEDNFSALNKQQAGECEKNAAAHRNCTLIIASQQLKECADKKSAECHFSPADTQAAQANYQQRLHDYEYQVLTPLANLLRENPADFFHFLSKKRESQYIYLARQESPDFADEVLGLNIPALREENGYKRFYPSGEILGYVIGYTGIDDKGQEGLEKIYESRLAGQNGEIKLLQDIHGRTLRVVREVMPASPGTALHLSIDKRIQFIADRVLSKTLSADRAKSASAVMIDVRTGEILAMATVPSGNPNNSVERRKELINNRTVTEIFEPGSTMKPLAVAAALDFGVITPHTVFQKGRVYVMGKNQVVKDEHDYGTQNTIGIIRKSSNVGMAKISERIPRGKYYQFMQKLGFGHTTGLGFPGETAGILHNSAKLNAFDFATNTFGYGISVSTLQMAHAYATLANGGVKMPLSIVKLNYRPEGERVISKKTAAAVTEMLKEAVQTGGTGTRATMESYTVAGKTGTAHKIINGKYVDRYYSVFAGFAPADNPRIAMVVMVDDPKGKYFGGLIAAPPFAEIAEWSLKLLGVLPDKIAKTGNVKLITPQPDTSDTNNPPKSSHETK